MNTYKKYCPNVFIAQCSQQYQKGDEIVVTTKYGKENECIIHNFMYEKDGFFYYSITRSDGFNSQERARNKVEKLEGYAVNAEKRSNEAWQASQEGRDFLSLGEPIKVGHHSEGRHRALIERNHRRMEKAVNESDKAEEYQRRSEYWESMTDKIDLSMPESIDYYAHKLEKATEYHEGLKSGKYKREHSYSLTYANKDKKEAAKNYELAVKLWGEQDQIQEIDNEKKVEAETKAKKKSKTNKAIEKYGCFFAFNTDQFKEGYRKLIEDGHLLEDEKVSHIGAGAYVPHKNAKGFINAIK